VVLLAEEGEGHEWQEYDLSVAEQLDDYWDRLQGLASAPQLDNEVLSCFPFSHVREVRPDDLQVLMCIIAITYRSA